LSRALAGSPQPDFGPAGARPAPASEPRCSEAGIAGHAANTRLFAVPAGGWRAAAGRHWQATPGAAGCALRAGSQLPGYGLGACPGAARDHATWPGRSLRTSGAAVSESEPVRG
jgi:hypothetical protein